MKLQIARTLKSLIAKISRQNTPNSKESIIIGKNNYFTGSCKTQHPSLGEQPATEIHYPYVQRLFWWIFQLENHLGLVIHRTINQVKLHFPRAESIYFQNPNVENHSKKYFQKNASTHLKNSLIYATLNVLIWFTHYTQKSSNTTTTCANYEY